MQLKQPKKMSSYVRGPSWIVESKDELQISTSVNKSVHRLRRHYRKQSCPPSQRDNRDMEIHFVSPSICPSVCPSIYFSICPSICLCPFICPSVSICLSVCPAIFPSVYPSVPPSVPPEWLSWCVLHQVMMQDGGYVQLPSSLHDGGQKQTLMSPDVMMLGWHWPHWTQKLLLV